MSPSNRFDKSLGFLLADVSRLLRRDFDNRVRPLGVSQAQWRAIAHIAREEGINQTTLADRLEVKPITIARLLDRMAAAGWVERRADASDRRASRLFLTGRAKPLLDRLEEHAAAARAALMRGITRTESEALVRTLERMKRNLAAAEDRAVGTGSRQK